ncbi:hypothetical protein U5801_23925 [Lamprobacter modestohalophilus]|uniref:hypothetical protein n=1 Tax=Lamprobacter modestohalophilus TaxID=1064514 RepID=UPI002ADEC4C9|nr:hypothetical protein [Lamprobacter modestohalophilus]MEA1052834.1 hypothetical protein [Lamprobacter modestohalophilus]
MSLRASNDRNRGAAFSRISALVSPLGYRFLSPEQVASVTADLSVEAAMQQLDAAEHGTLMVLGSQSQLLGVLVDVEMTALLAEKKRLLTYPIIEYWLDIGRHPDLELARAEFDVHFGEG